MITWRLRIVDAMSRVDGITAHTSMPDIPVAGDAWPVWVSADPGVLCGPAQNWWVYVILPVPTLADTLDALDPWVVAAFDALQDVGDVTLAEPVGIAITGDPASTGAPWPALRFTLSTMGGSNG